MSLLERSALPVRPARKAGESLPGYVYRLYNANGHAVPAEIHANLSLLYSNAAQAQRDAAAAQLAVVSGGLDDADWPRWRTWHGWLKQSYAWLRLCPACLQENSVHLALWELPLVKACPAHRTVLAEQCDCGRKLAWRWIAPDQRCRCGKPFTALNPVPASEGMVVLARLVAACLSTQGGDRRVGDWPLPAEYQGMSLDQLYAEINFLYQLESKLHRHLGIRGNSKSPSASVGMLLTDWPHNFDAHLHTWVRWFFEKDRGNAIVRLGGNMPLVKLQQTLPKDRPGQPMPAVTRKQLNAFIQSIRVPLSWPGLFLIDPALASRLDLAWLRSFYEQTEREAGLPDGRNDKRASADSRQAKVMRQVINLFIGRAMHRNTPTPFRRVALAWPSLPEYTGENPLGWLAHLLAPLQSASYAHICYLRETLETASHKENGEIR